MTTDISKRRNQAWFRKEDHDGFVRRSWRKTEGYQDYPADQFGGRPAIGICKPCSKLTHCNSHSRDLAEFVQSSVPEAGGLAGRRIVHPSSPLRNPT